MKTVRQLSDERGEKLDRIEAITNGAKAQNNRDLTKDEKDEFDRLYAEIKALDPEITRAKQKEELDAQMAGVHGVRITANGPEKQVLSSDTYWRDDRGTALRVYKPEEKMQVPQTDEKSYSFGDMARMVLTGAKGMDEKRFLNETTASEGGHLVPSVLGNEFIDLFRAKSHVISAGARTVNMGSSNLRLAKLLSDPVVSWRLEGTNVAETAATFDKVDWYAKSLAAYIPVSRELLQDASNLSSILSSALSAAMAQEIDRAALLGSGVDPQPKGIINYSGIQTMALGANGGTITSWDLLLQAYERMYNVNAGNPTAAIMHPRTWLAFNSLKDTTNQPLQKPDAIKNLPLLQTSKLPINLTKGTATNCSQIFLGDYTQLYIGVREGITLEVTQIPLNLKLQTVFLIHARIDIAAVRENNFVVIPDVKPV